MTQREFRLGVGALTGLVGAALLLRLSAWPPHEDETLVLHVARGSFGELASTVLEERGGAPLHFALAWAVAHVDGGLVGLRLISAFFAVAAVPLVALLGARLADRTVGLVAAALASTSWVFLFHGIYGRMYSLFLCTSLLSFLALLAAVRRGGAGPWGLWVAAAWLTAAAHPYGALVLAAQALSVLLARARLRQALVAFAAVGVLGTPFWLATRVLADRFDVGVGGGGTRLGDPVSVLSYLGRVIGDFGAGPVVLPVTLALAAAGAWRLRRTRPDALLLAGCVFGVPALAFLLARLGSGTAPETRHLIFALPFLVLLVAVALVEIWRLPRPHARPAAALTLALLLVGGLAWTWEKTPLLVEGEPLARSVGRELAARWLVEEGGPRDVLLGYEPAFLRAWELDDGFSRLVLPRADARLAARGLEEAARPLGRGVWVFNAHATTNVVQRLWIPRRLPRPAERFEARAFGPYLVLRTREPVETTARYLEHAAAAMILGKTMAIGDADVNFETIARAAGLLDYAASASERSRSTSSR